MPRTASPAANALAAPDVIFLAVLQGLETHVFVPAQRLVESDLAVQFKVGRNAVREAFQRLASEGIVELHRHRGAAIRSLNYDETIHVLDVAEAMTVLLARTAAKAFVRTRDGRMLEDALRALSDADKSSDPYLFAAARRAFYRALLDIGGNQELRRLFPSIQMPVVYAQYRLTNLQAVRLADYQKIGAAVLAADAGAAEDAVRLHVQRIRAAIDCVAKVDFKTASKISG